MWLLLIGVVEYSTVLQFSTALIDLFLLFTTPLRIVLTRWVLMGLKVVLDLGLDLVLYRGEV